MKPFYFTFGSNHLGTHGQSLGTCYVQICAADEESARSIIHDIRGPKWAFSYDEANKPKCIDRWNLTEVTLNDIQLPTI